VATIARPAAMYSSRAFDIPSEREQRTVIAARPSTAGTSATRAGQPQAPVQPQLVGQPPQRGPRLALSGDLKSRLRMDAGHLRGSADELVEALDRTDVGHGGNVDRTGHGCKGRDGGEAGQVDAVLQHHHGLGNRAPRP